MAQTFGDTVRSVRQHCPIAPPMLARSWVQTAANRLGDRRHWSHLRAESELFLAASRSGTATATQGSDIVAPGTLTFSAADVGRQIQFSGKGLPSTIIAYSAPNVQIDRNWVEATVTAGTAKVVSAYVTMPEDFGTFIAVMDPARDALLYWWATEDELNFRDPGRTESGEVLILASRRLATAPAADLGRVQYEAWPYASSASKFPYYYSKRPKEYADADNFEGIFRHRADLILLGALAECAEWPGLEGRRNPYYSLELASRKRRELGEEADRLETRDEEMYLTWLETTSWIHGRSLTMTDSNWLRNHE